MKGAEGTDVLRKRMNGIDSEIAELTAERSAVATEMDRIEAAVSAGPSAVTCRKKISVIGGRGKMGQWMLRHLSAMDASVNIIDIGEGSIDDARDSDIVIISVPISCVRRILGDLDRICRNDTLIFDISSVKSPFAGDLRKMAEYRRICSVHPMFGPSAQSLEGRTVVICDCGCAEAASEAKALFAADGVNIITTSPERHDDLMSYVLAFAHASNIAFFTVLRESGIPFGELKNVSSTTFGKCLDACIPVSGENAELYHSIQKLNLGTGEMWDIYENALKKVRDASLSDDPKMFIDLMDKGKKYLDTP
jgi:chorismate mutase/prephenate dehydrogenase